VDHNYELYVHTPAGTFTAYLFAGKEDATPRAWLDSEIRMVGVCISKFTRRNQLIAFELLVQESKDVTVL